MVHTGNNIHTIQLLCLNATDNMPKADNETH